MDTLYALEAIRLRVHLRTVTPVVLPAYKGSTFHGGFGWGLKHAAPLLYGQIFAPQDVEAESSGSNDNASLPKPFVLVPPLELQQAYPAGADMHCDLVLIGDAVRHLSACICALDQFARDGVGKQRARLDLVRVETLPPGGEPQMLYSAAGNRWQSPPPRPNTGHELVAPWQGIDAKSITLTFQTRMRLKDDNKLVRTPPRFHLFISRLLGRLNMLSLAHQRVRLIDEDTKAALLAQAGEIGIRHHSLSWDDWSRYSGRQQTWMKFGGLLGDITYCGNLTPFLPYLALGEWFHVGGKSSFGLGKYLLKAN